MWNGNIEGDEEGKLTYISVSDLSVIDYAIENMETRIETEIELIVVVKRKQN